jgi:hypothetical protein
MKASLAEQEAKVAARRERDAIRQRKSRSSRAVTVTPCDSTDTLPLPPLDKEKSPRPPKEINPLPAPSVLEANASSASGDAGGSVIKLKTGRKVDPTARAEFVEAWNDLAGSLSLPQILKLTPKRTRALDLRLASYSVDDCVKVLANIRGSPFLRGETGWRGCSFDWVLNETNFQKILEGNYNGQPVQIRRA